MRVGLASTLLDLSCRRREGSMERLDIEQIARLVVRDYGLRLRLATVSIERTGGPVQD